MVDISFGERLKIIFDLIKSQSFFLTLFAILILTVIVLIVNFKVKSKAPRYAVAIAYLGLTILVLARYGKYVLAFNDSIVEKVFKAMYFPNLPVYFSILVASILLLLVMIIDKKFSIVTKITNVICFCSIWFFFILTVDLVKKENIDFLEAAQVYGNKSVMTLLQTSTSIFAIWIGVILMDLLIRKLDNKTNKTKEIEADTALEVQTIDVEINRQ